MRTRLSVFAAIVSAMSVAPACRPAVDPAVVRAEINAKNARWARLTATGRADSIADFYHPQGVLYPPNMRAVQGRDSIRAFFAVMNTMSSPPPTLTVSTDSVWVMEHSAMELGRWTFSWPAPGRPPGTPAIDSGRYVVRWVSDNGRWLMVQNIWNSATPHPTGG